MRFSFANRRPELAELDRFFRDPARGSAAKLCIVSGPTGVGKSRLVDEAVAAAGLDHAFTRVRITLGEVQFGGESGFFLRATAIAVSLANKKRRRATLEDFARSRGGLAVLRAALGAGAKKLEKLSTGNTEAAADMLSAWHDERQALHELLGEPSLPALRLASGYLLHAARAGTLALAIENAQQIDPESLRFLSQVARDAVGARLVYEYMETEKGTSAAVPYGALRDICLSSAAALTEIRLTPMPFEVLRQESLRQYDSHFVEGLRLGYGGNVRDLERDVELVSQRVEAGAPLDRAGIRESLLNFTTEQKVTLWIVALCRGNLDPYELTEITSYIRPEFRPADPLGTAKGLSPFIEIRNGLFAIDHDSLLPKLEALEPIRRDALIASMAASQYFQSFLAREDYRRYSEYEILFALLRLSVTLNSSDLADVAIRRLAAGAQKGGRPAGLLHFVNDFARNAEGQALHATTVRRLIGIIYDACWLEGAVDLLAAHESLGLDVQMSLIQALSLTGHHPEAERRWQSLVERLGYASLGEEKKSRIHIYSVLTGTLIARLRGDYQEARRRYERLSPRDIRRDDDLSVYHRFSEVADVAGVASRLEKAREVALRLHDPTNLIRANVTLSNPVAESGDLGRAFALLDEAEALAPASYVDQYMILHNRLAAEMYSGAASPETFARLDGILPLVIDSMDRVLIANGLLAASVSLGDVATADRYARFITDALANAVEPNIRRGALFNCAQFYTSRADDAIARSFREEAYAMRLGFDEIYWDARRAGSRDSGVDFRLVSNFDLSMMTNWYFTWPDFDRTTG